VVGEKKKKKEGGEKGGGKIEKIIITQSGIYICQVFIIIIELK
jgi:hypothetical protein